MSITKDFESRLLPLHNSTVYGKDETEALLEHTRALETMLKKVEWRTEQFRGAATCGECGETHMHGHAESCALSKLLEGVE